MFVAGWGEDGMAALSHLARGGRAALLCGRRFAVVPVNGLQHAQIADDSVWLLGTALERGIGLVPLNAEALLECERRRSERLDSPSIEADVVGSFIVASEVGGSVRVRADHLGSRQLVWARLGNGGIIAEQVIDLLGLLPTLPEPNRISVINWIDLRLIPLGRTLFSGIRRLSAGEMLELSADSPRELRWWRPAYRPPTSMTCDEAAEVMLSAAFASVRRSSVGARKPAALLSGGLDSGCVVAALAVHAAAGPRACAVTFPDYPEVDECELIAATARATGAELTVLPEDGSGAMLADCLSFLERWRVPSATPNLFVWSPISEYLAKCGYAIIDGEGGDEMFGGAPRLLGDLVRRGRLLSAWRLTGKLPQLGANRAWRYRARLVANGGYDDALAREHKKGTVIAKGDRRYLLELAQADSSFTGNGPIWWQARVHDHLRVREALDASGHFRRDAAWRGLDRRQPFMHDVQLLESVLDIPPNLNFARGVDRPLLRRGLARYLPQVVVGNTRKAAFARLPLSRLRGRDGTILRSLLLQPSAPIREFLDPRLLDRLLMRLGADPYDWISLYNVGMVDLWLRSLEDPRVIDRVRKEL